MHCRKKITKAANQGIQNAPGDGRQPKCPFMGGGVIGISQGQISSESRNMTRCSVQDLSGKERNEASV